MKDRVISETTGKSYDPAEAIRIINSLQAASYMAHNAELLDVYPSVDYKTQRPLMVFIFNRKDTQELYDRWCRHEL